MSKYIVRMQVMDDDHGHVVLWYDDDRQRYCVHSHQSESQDLVDTAIRGVSLVPEDSLFTMDADEAEEEFMDSVERSV